MQRRSEKQDTTRGVRRRPSHAAAAGHRRTRADHAAEIAEDYVELIDDLIRETGEARSVDLAGHLGVTHVTVSKTVDRLKKQRLVTSAPYRSIFLTDAGRRLAAYTRQRHKTVLDFLVALGVPKRDAEADAEGVEHHISPKTLAAMKRFLGRGGTSGRQ